MSKRAQIIFPAHVRLLAALLLPAALLLFAMPVAGQPREETKSAPTESKSQVSTSGPLLSTSWPATPGAPGYSVEIRDETGRVLVASRTEENRISFRLHPGNYQYRVAVLNKFKKAGAWSLWAPLVVRVSLIPRLSSVRPRELSIPIPSAGPVSPESKSADPKPKRLTLLGKNLLPDTSVLIRSESGPVHIERTEYVGPEELRVYLSPKELKPGVLTIRVRNPGEKAGREQKSVAVVVGGPREDVAMIRPMRRDPRRKWSPERQRELARAEHRAMVRRALIPGLGPLQRGDPYEIGLWSTLYGSYLVGGLYEWQQGNEAVARATKPPLSLFADPVIVLVAASRLASGATSTDNMTWLGAAAALQSKRVADLRAEHRLHQERQVVYAGLALGTYLVQVYGESFRGFDLKKLVPGLPQYQAGNWQEGALWATGFGTLALGSLYAYRQGAAEADNARRDPLIGVLANPFGAGLALTTSGNTLFTALVAKAFADRGRTEARYDSMVRLQYGLAVGAAAVAVAYLVSVPPPASASGDSAGRHSGEHAPARYTAGVQAGFPLFYHGPDGRGHTATTVGWMLVF